MENSSSSVPFAKGEWVVEYPVDVGFGNIYPLLLETPENAGLITLDYGFDVLTSRGRRARIDAG